MSSTDHDLIDEGRRHVRIVANLLQVTGPAWLVIYLGGFGTRGLALQVVVVVLNMILAAGIVRGRAWARWSTVVVVLYAMAGLVPAFWGGHVFRLPELVPRLVAVVLYVLYSLIVQGLVYPASVRAFFRAERERRAEEKARP